MRGERYVLSEGFAPGYIKVKPSRLNQRVTFSLLPERQYHETLGYCLPGRSGWGERYVLSEGFAPGYIKVKPSRLSQRVTFSLLPGRQYHETLGYSLPPSLLRQ